MAVINGTNDADFLVGTPEADTIDGGAGDDYLLGSSPWEPGGGDDTFIAGPGDDQDVDQEANTTDVLRLTGSLSEYLIVPMGTGSYGFADLVKHRDDTEITRGIEIFEFADGSRTAADFASILGSTFDYGLTGGEVEGTANNDFISPGDNNDTVHGLGGDDWIDGGSGNDSMWGGAGNDYLVGGDGGDMAMYSGNFADYTITKSTRGKFIVTDQQAGRDGRDVVNVEILCFADRSVSHAQLLALLGESTAGIDTTGPEFQGVYGGSNQVVDAQGGVTLQFGEYVLLGQGNIRIYDDSGAVVLTLPARDYLHVSPWYTNTGNLDLGTGLQWGHHYRLGFDAGVMTDVEGNGVAAVAFDQAIPFWTDDYPEHYQLPAELAAIGHVTTDGVPTAAAVGYQGDGDVFGVDLVAGTTYRFAIASTSGELRPSLRGFSGEVQQFDVWADIGASQVEHNLVAPTSGTYFLLANRSVTMDGTGTYTVSALAMPDDQPGLVSQARPLSVDGQSLSGTVDFAADTDLFKVNLVAGHSYVFEAKSSPGGLDPKIEVVWFDGETAISWQEGMNPDDGTSRLYFVPETTGNFYVGVSSDAATTGGYAVTAAPLNTIQSPGQSQPYVGTVGSDAMYGSWTDDSFRGNGGNDFMNGNGGIDVALYAGVRSNYSVDIQDYGSFVTAKSGDEGQDWLQSVERLQFANTKVALDLEGNAGTVARLLGAIFGPEAAHTPEYVGIALSLLDPGNLGGWDLASMALNVRLGANPSNTVMVTAIFENLFGVAPAPDMLASLVYLLDSHSYSQASLAFAAAMTSYEAQAIGLDAMMTTGLEYL